jgi:hypothetical protein
MTSVARISSWKRVVIQRGLEHRSRGIAIVRSRYEATTGEETADWKRPSVCWSD